MNAKLKSILVLIARNPSIRTVEIADRVDCDMDQVQPQLQAYIDAGHILVIPVTAPNGRPANGFMFTEKARKGDEFRALFEEGASAPAVAAPAAPAPAPATVASSAPGISKVEVAIRYIKANGNASPQQLRELLKLEPRQHPMAYLGGALKDGRLKLANGHYFLGNGTPPAPPAPAKRKAAPTQAPAPAMAIDTTPGPALSHAQVDGASSGAAQSSQPPAPAMAGVRCALWSDGVVELQRDGKTVIALTADELRGIEPVLRTGLHRATVEVRP